MRGSERGRARRPPVVEQHYVLTPICAAAKAREPVRLHVSSAGTIAAGAQLPDFVLDRRCRLAVRWQQQALLHRLGRTCPLSADRALVVLDGDVLECGDRRWRIGLGARWWIWKESDTSENRGGRWPAALALAACLGFTPVASAQTARGRDRGAATANPHAAPNPPARAPVGPTSPAQPSPTTASEEAPSGAKDEPTSALGQLMVNAFDLHSNEGDTIVFRARLVGLDGRSDESQSSPSGEFKFSQLLPGKYKLTVVQEGTQGRTATTEIAIAPGATTQAEVELSPPPGDPIRDILPGVQPIMPRWSPRHFGENDRSHEEEGYWSRPWPTRLVRRPLSPWPELLEARAPGEVDLGQGHAGSPIRLAPSLALGMDRHWGLALDTRRGICMNGGDAPCERRFDQASVDLIYVVDSEATFEWLAQAGLATGPFDPFALSLRAGGAAKALLADWLAVQLEVLAQVPVSQRDAVPTLVMMPTQLQLQLSRHLAAFLATGFRGAFVSGHEDLTVPAGAGLLLGWHAFDIGAEWRFSRVLGTDRTWDERSLLLTLRFRSSWAPREPVMAYR